MAAVRAHLVGLVTAALMLVGTAQAAPRTELVHLEYQAPAECPERGVLESAILARTAAARFTTAADAERVFAVLIAAADDGGYRGALDVRDGGTSTTRDLAAPRCDDLVAALSLIIALAIDPTAPAIVTAPLPPPPPPPRAPGRPVETSAIGGGLVVAGITPGPAMTAALEGRIGWRGVGHIGAAGLLGYDSDQMASGRAGFLWIAGRASACWQWLATGVDSDMCAHGEIGGLVVSADDIVNAQGSRRLWLAPGGHVAARWPRTSRIFGELQAGVSFPLLRERFYFAPGTSIHSTWAAVPWVSISAGVRFQGSK